MLTGGVSCNKDFQTIISWLTKKSQLPLLVAPSHLCTDNAAMVAWMGHELLRAEQDVDIRQMKVDAHRRIPLGSYVRDLMNFKLTGEQQKVLSGLRKIN